MWLDVLDVALHLFLGTDAFQPGPVSNNPLHHSDAMFEVANIVPVLESAPQLHSPVFRYPRAAAQAALAVAPRGADGLRRVRYVNPLTGGACMSLLDCYSVAVDSKKFSLPFRTSYSVVCSVVKGSGKTKIGDTEISWSEKDVFTLPYDSWVSHMADGDAQIFMVTNRDLYARLGLLREEYEQ